MKKQKKAAELIGQAVQHLQQGNVQDAQKLIKKVLRTTPDSFDAWHIAGAIYATKGDTKEAIRCFKKAILLDSSKVAAQYNLAKTLSLAGNEHEAIEHYQHAIKLAPNNVDAWLGYAYSLTNLNRHDQALVSYEQGLKLNGNSMGAWANRGIVLTSLSKFEDAVVSFKKALELGGESNAILWDNYGTTLYLMGQYDEAMVCYAKSMSIDSNIDFVFGNWLRCKMMQCDWADIDQAFANLNENIRLNKKVASPFVVLATPVSAQRQLECAKIYSSEVAPVRAAQKKLPISKPDEKITIGYFSADYHNHATTYLMAELFEQHDRAKFKLIAYSFGPDKQDQMRQRVESAFDEFYDVNSMTDEEVAALARSHKVDIAVDLKGYTTDNRVGIFSYQAAPIQVNYLGYPGTVGMPYMDYIIADHELIDEKARQDYSEKIVYMPHSYQVNDSTREISSTMHTREQHGLPEAGFIFCCFNNSYKISADAYAIWMRLLEKVPGSILWLLAVNDTIKRNLYVAAEKHGIEQERIKFASLTTLPEHLARLKLADLFLDTFYYNAHTSASDALWAGVPVVTFKGATFASRVGASLLSAVELPELITHSAQEYESLAYELATQPEKLLALRNKLKDNRQSSSLFNGTQFARDLEKAYLEMRESYLQGSPPADIDLRKV